MNARLILLTLYVKYVIYSSVRGIVSDIERCK